MHFRWKNENENKEIMNNMKSVITDKYEMSYIRKMGNPKTHKTENELIIILPVGCYWAKKTDWVFLLWISDVSG